MDNYDAFERQLAREIECEVGPPVPVDTLAITCAAMAPVSRWRDRTMFRVITSAAGIGVAAVMAGAFLLVNLPSGGDHSVAPGSPADVTPVAAYVHGGPIATGSCCGDQVETFDEEGHRLTLRNMERWDSPWSFDDPRLSGQARFIMHIDEFPQAGTDERVEIWWGDVRVENADGAWTGTRTLAYDSEQPVESSISVYELMGEGAYEGLSALLFEQYDGGFPPRLFGAIFPGPLPPRSLDTGSAGA